SEVFAIPARCAIPSMVSLPIPTSRTSSTTAVWTAATTSASLRRPGFAGIRPSDIARDFPSRLVGAGFDEGDCGTERPQFNHPTLHRTGDRRTRSGGCVDRVDIPHRIGDLHTHRFRILVDEQDLALPLRGDKGLAVEPGRQHG